MNPDDSSPGFPLGNVTLSQLTGSTASASTVDGTLCVFMQLALDRVCMWARAGVYEGQFTLSSTLADGLAYWSAPANGTVSALLLLTTDGTQALVYTPVLGMASHCCGGGWVVFRHSLPCRRRCDEWLHSDD